MKERKTQTSQLVKSMVHGRPSKKNSQPCMFDIFNWDLQCQEIDAKNSKIKQENISKSYVYQNPNNNKNQRNDINNQIQYCNNCTKCKGHIPIYQQSDPQKHPDQYMIGIGKPKSHLKPHAVKNELYMYDNVHIKRNQSEQHYQNQSQFNKNSQAVKQKKKLNQNDQTQRKIIQKRKQKIKQFKQFTRELPNSAFTTYYGRPAFQSYGRCNSGSQLKTHNVMPHRGQNNPKQKQTFQSALIKGKKVKTQDHLPRKPIQMKVQQKDGTNTEKHPIHLPLQKPDLINHVRFADPQPQSDRKQPVPSFQKLKQQAKIKQKKQSRRTNKKKNKNKDNKSVDALQQDGLKYMNTRDHLISLIEAKKLKDSKLAYKVTECYPDLTNDRKKTQSQAQQIQKPAGKVFQKSQPAQKIIYRRY